jgi:hypothetical protein
VAIACVSDTGIVVTYRSAGRERTDADGLAIPVKPDRLYPRLCRVEPFGASLTQAIATLV